MQAEEKTISDDVKAKRAALMEKLRANPRIRIIEGRGGGVIIPRRSLARKTAGRRWRTRR